MKKVFNNSDLAHVFNLQNQSEGNNPNKSLFFIDNQIYSYGYHFCIARIQGEKIYFTNRRYSHTTAKQLALVRNACSDRQFIFCPYPEKNIFSIEKNFTFWANKIKFNEQKAGQARKAEKYIFEIEICISEFKKYLENIINDNTVDFQFNKNEDFRFLNSYNVQSVDFTEIKNRIKAEQKRKENLFFENLKLWQNNERESIAKVGKFDYLRLNGDNIETTQRIKIEAKNAIQLFNFIKASEVGTRFLDWIIKEKDKKSVQIGCHRIEFKEMERIIKQIESVLYACDLNELKIKAQWLK
jgi:hypothetical protein